MEENSTAASVVNCALEIHKELGLINFGGELLKGNIQRLVNELDELTL